MKPGILATLMVIVVALLAYGMRHSIMSVEAIGWWKWHSDKREVEQAVLDAINEPGGGDYAKAVDAVQRSDIPVAVKQFQIGQLIVGGHVERSKRRSPETLEQGVRLMEEASIAPGQRDESNVQQLRFLFECGAGRPPVTVPKDAIVAACWLAIERERSEDRARCIALRRQRLPHIG